MNKLHNLILFFTVFVLGLLLLQNANAQIIPSFNVITEPVPLFAGDTAVVSVVPNNFETASTTFQWYINDILKTSISGLGRNSITIETVPGKQEIINIKVAVNPGPGFTKIERQSLIATIIPFKSTDQTIKEIQKFRADFKIIAIPDNPSPGQNVHFSVQAIGFDPDRTKIQWFVNDKLELSGMGEKGFKLPTGKLGETYKVRVNVTLADGTTNTKTETIRVNGLSYYWWADSVVPAWYKGKALPSVHSKVTIMALPELGGVSPANLVYKWQFNGGPVINKSGYAKQTFSLTPQFQGVREEITVIAENMSGTAKKEKSILIFAVTPLAQFYQLKPLEGQDTSRTINFLEAAPASILDFVADLFHFPPTASPDLSYQWQLGGRNVPSKEPASPNIISIRSQNGQIPEQFVQLNVENKKIRNGGVVSNSFRLRYR